MNLDTSSNTHTHTHTLSICENTELKKSNEALEEKIKTLEKSLSQASTSCIIDEPSIIDKLKEEVVYLTKNFGKFLESSKTLTMLLKYHQHPMTSMA